MSDQPNPLDTASEPEPTEFEILKMRAARMGIQHSNNIGIETLRDKIRAKMNNEPDVPSPPQVNAFDGSHPDDAPVSLRDHLIKDAMKLVRCRITNLDPKKKDLQGEIITVANEHIGTVRKFIPFGEVTENGYHMEKILFDFLDSRKFVNIQIKKDTRTGQEIVLHTLAKEFALEVLEPLSKAELAELRRVQESAGYNAD